MNPPNVKGDATNEEVTSEKKDGKDDGDNDTGEASEG